MIYINRKDANYLETVDEFDAPSPYVREMLSEYRMSDPSAHYYLSKRACRAWREDGVTA
jgi:hypothetical protein